MFFFWFVRFLPKYTLLTVGSEPTSVFQHILSVFARIEFTDYIN